MSGIKETNYHKTLVIKVIHYNINAMIGGCILTDRESADFTFSTLTFEEKNLWNGFKNGKMY